MRLACFEVSDKVHMMELVEHLLLMRRSLISMPLLAVIVPRLGMERCVTARTREPVGFGWPMMLPTRRIRTLHLPMVDSIVSISPGYTSLDTVDTERTEDRDHALDFEPRRCPMMD